MFEGKIAFKNIIKWASVVGRPICKLYKLILNNYLLDEVQIFSRFDLRDDLLGLCGDLIFLFGVQDGQGAD